MQAAPRPDAPWMDASAAGPATQWRIDGQARTPAPNWLYTLGVQSQGRWRPVVHAPAPGEREVQWWQGGVLQGRLWLGPERVRWCDAQARCEEAVLDEGVGSALLNALD